jgi:alkylhydroperoxidase family enzyme
MAGAVGAAGSVGAAAGGGAPPHPWQVAGEAAPELVDWWLNSFSPTVFAAGRAPRRVKELLRLRLELAHGVRFPALGDVAAAGIGEAEAAALGGPLAALPLADGERAVLALADELALRNMEGYLDEELYARLAAHYDDGAIFELGMTMAILCGFAKFLQVYGLTGAG